MIGVDSMSEKIWRHFKQDLVLFYIEIDKQKTSRQDLLQVAFKAAKQLGYVTTVEFVTESSGDGAYLDFINRDEKSVLESIEQLGSKIVQPTDEMISFLDYNTDVIKMDIDIAAPCYDENGKWSIVFEVVNLAFYTDLDNGDWDLCLSVNTDIFLPFRWVKDERTKEMARRNVPRLKRYMEEMFRLLPISNWEWEADGIGLKTFLPNLDK